MRVCWVDLRTPFTGGAEALDRGAGRIGGDGPEPELTGSEAENFEVVEAGRAEEFRAHPADIVSTLFEIDGI